MRIKNKKIMSLVLALAMVVTSLGMFCTAPVSAASVTASQAADALNKLGLFNGVGTKSDGTPDYALTTQVDRQTATVMLVRVMGKESAAAGASCKFSDVSSWAQPCVGWAASNGYVNGYNSSSFGGKDNMTAQQFLTLCLRALGYKDSGSSANFTYATACTYAKTVGISDGSYTNSTKSFTRGDIAIVCYKTLYTKMNGSNKTLYETNFGGSSSGSNSSSGTTGTTVASTGGYTNSAPGTQVSKSSDGVTVIDYSNSSQGYVMIKTTQSGNPKLVVQIAAPNGTTYKYFYTSAAGTYEAFPLTEGNGTYKIGVYKNTTGTKYATLHSASITVSISDSLSPFLRPNFFVDYTSNTKCVQYAKTLCSGISGELNIVQKVYAWVIDYFSYDYDKASSVESGYRPVLDTVYAAKKGICFDYAATMTAMLRSQGVPTKLVVGYAGTQYHAWISVYTKSSGWVESVIYFDGQNWKLMDPTYASTGNSSESIMEYINNSGNYSAKYMY